MCYNMSVYMYVFNRKRNVRRKVLQNDVATVNSSDEVQYIIMYGKYYYSIPLYFY